MYQNQDVGSRYVSKSKSWPQTCSTIFSHLLSFYTFKLLYLLVFKFAKYANVKNSVSISIPMLDISHTIVSAQCLIDELWRKCRVSFQIRKYSCQKTVLARASNTVSAMKFLFIEDVKPQDIFRRHLAQCVVETLRHSKTYECVNVSKMTVQ